MYLVRYLNQGSAKKGNCDDICGLLWVKEKLILERGREGKLDIKKVYLFTFILDIKLHTGSICKM